MPMSFPDMKSLIRAAEAHHFRGPNLDETEEEFRKALADHVEPIDLIESCEIRNKVGWNQWNTPQQVDMLHRSGNRKKP